MASGKIGVTTENIFPVIKKFLYSDHEIFLRELVSNAIDASRKLRTLASFGDYKGEVGDLKVKVTVDKEAGTLIVSDRGIGMDASDVDKYINQIAFSGAEEFLAKYKDSDIIGHFGLGFYSAFMVSKKVEIISLSYKEGAKPVKWSCDGSPEYEMTEEGVEKAERGTDIVLYIDDDSKEFLEQARIDTLLKKYCRFLPLPVVSGKEQEWKDGKMVDTDKDKVINATEPVWTKKPSDLSDEDYLKFYHELMPGSEDPMFWIHLNVDYPFTLTGVLYFPKIRNNFDIRKDRIQLYCNQVFVTDQVEGVVPEFMTLMQGVIDSPDIPLNVSRSYLQADTAVKKISGYISKKVAEKLASMYKDDVKAYEAKWDDIKIFIEYGMLTDEKFCDSAMKFVLLKDVDGQYFNLEDYRKLVEASQTDKDGNVIYLYATDHQAQYSYISAAKDKGYNVLLMDGQLDSHFISMLEGKGEKLRFVRVDSDIADRLIVKDEERKSGLTPEQTDIMSTLFKAGLADVEKAEFIVQFEALSPEAAPAMVTQNEFMRRMKDMSAQNPNMGIYGELPDSYMLVVNTEHPAVKAIIAEADKALADKVSPMRETIASNNKVIEDSRKESSDKKDDTEAAKALNEKISAAEQAVKTARDEQETLVKEYAKTQPKVQQIDDLALLAAGLLKGSALAEFVKRSAILL
ncbi:MAG: molecular chaperone HtpG [Prevotella sp.]|nr:molecular chaperone HtpG [Prevotella sp.]MCM1074272.1 molecular chaperone HtpG [Ruminococcus sp.]